MCVCRRAVLMRVFLLFPYFAWWFPLLSCWKSFLVLPLIPLSVLILVILHSIALYMLSNFLVILSFCHAATLVCCFAWVLLPRSISLVCCLLRSTLIIGFDMAFASPSSCVVVILLAGGSKASYIKLVLQRESHRNTEHGRFPAPVELGFLSVMFCQT
jgi:hypothetical protein